jgi:hypothetical protein
MTPISDIASNVVLGVGVMLRTVTASYNGPTGDLLAGGGRCFVI